MASERSLFAWSKPANITVGEMKFAVEKNTIYILDDDGKQHKARIKKVQTKQPSSGRQLEAKCGSCSWWDLRFWLSQPPVPLELNRRAVSPKKPDYFEPLNDEEGKRYTLTLGPLGT